jgi:formylglycine-generating enzyme
MVKTDAPMLAGPETATFERPRHADMVWIPGATFLMGSDRHYPEEAPVHRVTVDGFWIDHAPVTNRQFREFVRATGHVSFAEIAPDAEDCPGALPNLLREAPWFSIRRSVR